MNDGNNNVLINCFEDPQSFRKYVLNTVSILYNMRLLVTTNYIDYERMNIVLSINDRE